MPGKGRVAEPGLVSIAAGIGVIERARRLAHPLPIYAIGGITVSRIPAVIHAGAHGVAVCGAILSSSAPERVVEGMQLDLDASRSVTLSRECEDPSGGLREAGSREVEEEDRLLLGQPEQRLEKLDGGLVRPVEVVHHHHDGLTLALCSQ